MRRLAMLALLLLARVPSALGDEPDAKVLAQEILTRGATLFESRDAVAMAATYAEDARLVLVSRDHDTGKLKVEEKQGRAEIATLYRTFFFGNADEPAVTARNHVEFARRLAPELLLIEGTFEPDVSRTARYAFVQERRKDGDRWLITSLRLYVVE